MRDQDRKDRLRDLVARLARLPQSEGRDELLRKVRSRNTAIEIGPEDPWESGTRQEGRNEKLGIDRPREAPRPPQAPDAGAG
jgi:hypothetical protein